VEANAPRGKYYIKNYYDIQPALNYGYANPNPNHPWEQPVDAPGPQAVRQELKDIISFWMNKGIDGFRVDLAASLVKSDPDKSATIKLWQEMTEWFGGKFPEGVLIAEWFNPKQSIKGGFNIDFFRGGSLLSRGRGGDPNKPLYFDKAGQGTVNDWYETFQDQYDNTVKTGMKFIEGMPDIEGSRNRSGSRTPMQWDSNINAGFSTAPADKIYIPLDPYPMVFMRWANGEKYIIAINPSDKKVEATISSPGTSKYVC